MKKQSLQTGRIYVTEPDYRRLTGLIEITRDRNGVDMEYPIRRRRSRIGRTMAHSSLG